MGENTVRGPVIVGMPLYNEEETVGSVVLQSLSHADEVLCVDDGSSDSSARIAGNVGATVKHHRANKGYGAALKSIFQHALEKDACALVILDSDGQHDPNDIPVLLEPILSGDADFVIGSRFIEGGSGDDMPAYRKLGVKVITAASNLTSDLSIRDTQSGFRAFSRDALKRIKFDQNGMESTLEMLEQCNEYGLAVKEVPTIIRYDVPKGSRFTAMSHGFTVLSYALISLSQKKPFLAFGLPGAGLVTLGSAIGMRALNRVNDFTGG
ncbi:MAG: glycosyltransferase family 2 protein, partial [Candidatus Poseidoniales archaeon]|nr:glycosyltransferase family 2 protein [Candidatus Poseidoniales archaeon]